jgi:hypothetical protein
MNCLALMACQLAVVETWTSPDTLDHGAHLTTNQHLMLGFEPLIAPGAQLDLGYD